MQSLWTGLSALNSASNWLDRVSDNVANQNTVGFAADQGSFADTLTAQLQASATAPTVSGRTTPLGWWGGTGVLSVGEGRNFQQMPLQKTDNLMDAAIQGQGFFEVQGPNGPLLTRAGNFTWSKRPDGQFELALPNGMPVLSTDGQPIIEPKQPASLNIGTNGQISFGTVRGPKLAVVEVTEPSSNLIPQGDNVYSVKPGVQIRNSASSTVLQGYLAMSNVDMTQQMTDMIQAQRMFDLNAESIQLSNQMMDIADSIKS